MIFVGAGLTAGRDFDYLYSTSAAVIQPCYFHHAPKMPDSQRVNWSKHLSLAALAAYWLLLFVATHVPPLNLIPPLPSDKLLHTVAFAVLSFLFALAWSVRRPFGWRQFLAVLAILAIYAAFDETTQPLMRRVADRLDWVADVVGALVGLTVFCGAKAIWRRMSTFGVE